MKLLFSSYRRVIGLALAFAVLFNISIVATERDLERRAHSGMASVMNTLLLTTDEALSIWVRNELGTLRNWVSYYRPFKTLVSELMPLKTDRKALANFEQSKRMETSIKTLMDNKGYLNYYLLSNDFVTLATASKTAHQLAGKGLQSLFSKPETISQLAAGHAVFVNQVGIESGERHRSQLYVVKAIVDGSGKQSGYFIFQLNPALQFSKVLNLGRFGQTGETYAFDYSGNLLSEPRFGSLNSSTSTGKIDQRLLLEQEGRTEKTQPLVSIHSGVTLGFNTEGYSDYRGVKVIGAWQWLDKLQLGVVTEINHEEAFYNLHETKFALTVCQILTNLLLLVTTVLNIRWQERMRRFSLTDPLTGIGNRQYLENELKRLLADAKRTGLPLTVMMLDIDKFKPYNDEFGHLQGDKALKQIAMAIQTAVPRQTDMVARYGGEEFCVVLPFSDHSEAEHVADRILASVRAQELAPSSKANHPFVSVSVGFVSLVVEGSVTNEVCLKMADEALYMAKEKLGNTTVGLSTVNPDSKKPTQKVG